MTEENERLAWLEEAMEQLRRDVQTMSRALEAVARSQQERSTTLQNYHFAGRFALRFLGFAAAIVMGWGAFKAGLLNMLGK
ncbi:MAG: hypothetical protein AAGA26_03270 [Pseudomonadota bacterium]